MRTFVLLMSLCLLTGCGSQAFDYESHKDVGNYKIVDSGQSQVGVFTGVEDLEDRLDVLLLHGASFEAGVWLENGVFESLGDSVNVYAADLPGRGGSGDWKGEDRLFVAEVIRGLGLDASRTIVVAPSLAGSFLLGEDTRTVVESLCGVVLVAPVGGREVKEAGASYEVPALVVWGDSDGAAPKRSAQELAAVFDPGEAVIIDNAGHDAYNQQPLVFVQEVLRFIENRDSCGRPSN